MEKLKMLWELPNKPPVVPAGVLAEESLLPKRLGPLPKRPLDPLALLVKRPTPFPKMLWPELEKMEVGFFSSSLLASFFLSSSFAGCYFWLDPSACAGSFPASTVPSFGADSSFFTVLLLFMKSVKFGLALSAAPLVAGPLILKILNQH